MVAVKREIGSWPQIFLSELIGTSLLLYLGCLGLFASPGEWKMLSPMQGSIVWGCLVSSIIVAIGHLSKAHLNPCVTVCAFLLGHIRFPTVFVYLIAEVSGALLGMYAMRISVPDTLYSMYNANAGPCGFCSTVVHSDLSLYQAFAFEFVATSLMIFATCGCWDPRNETVTDSNPIKFALLIVAISTTVGPFTGASMNPARSLAPAIVNSGWNNQWLYWAAPLSGSVFTTLFYKIVFLKASENDEPKKCSANAEQSSAMLKASRTSINETTMRDSNLRA